MKTLKESLICALIDEAREKTPHDFFEMYAGFCENSEEYIDYIASIHFDDDMQNIWKSQNIKDQLIVAFEFIKELYNISKTDKNLLDEHTCINIKANFRHILKQFYKRDFSNYREIAFGDEDLMDILMKFKRCFLDEIAPFFETRPLVGMSKDGLKKLVDKFETLEIIVNELKNKSLKESLVTEEWVNDTVQKYTKKYNTIQTLVSYLESNDFVKFVKNYVKDCDEDFSIDLPLGFLMSLCSYGTSVDGSTTSSTRTRIKKNFKNAFEISFNRDMSNIKDAYDLNDKAFQKEITGAAKDFENAYKKLKSEWLDTNSVSGFDSDSIEKLKRMLIALQKSTDKFLDIELDFLG